MSINEILYIALILYLIVMIVGYIFEVKWLYLIAGLLWFIPITQIDNIFIVMVSAVMLVVHGMLVLFEKKESGF